MVGSVYSGMVCAYHVGRVIPSCDTIFQTSAEQSDFFFLENKLQKSVAESPGLFSAAWRTAFGSPAYPPPCAVMLSCQHVMAEFRGWVLYCCVFGG